LASAGHRVNERSAEKGFAYGFVLFSRVKLSDNAVSSDCQAAHAQAENRFPHQAVPASENFF
jgi:hypothetical protein